MPCQNRTGNPMRSDITIAQSNRQRGPARTCLNRMIRSELQLKPDNPRLHQSACGLSSKVHMFDLISDQVHVARPLCGRPLTQRKF